MRFDSTQTGVDPEASCKHGDLLELHFTLSRAEVVSVSSPSSSSVEREVTTIKKALSGHIIVDYDAFHQREHSCPVSNFHDYAVNPVTGDWDFHELLFKPMKKLIEGNLRCIAEDLLLEEQEHSSLLQAGLNQVAYVVLT